MKSGTSKLTCDKCKSPAHHKYYPNNTTKWLYYFVCEKCLVNCLDGQIVCFGGNK